MEGRNDRDLLDRLFRVRLRLWIALCMWILLENLTFDLEVLGFVDEFQ